MPAPQPSMMGQLVKMNFTGQGIKLPLKWKQPNDQYDGAFKDGEKSVAPLSPTSLFAHATTNKYHVDAAKEMHQKFEKFIDGTVAAICDGIDKWMKMASISGVVVTGPTGMMPPSSVKGPPLGPLILAKAPKATPQETKFSNAIANAIGQGWQQWSMGLTGQLMYPSFAAFPGPMAPPTPNVPLPLVTFSSAGESALSPSMLKNQMQSNLGDNKALHAKELFDSIAQAFNTVFMQFKATTMVQNVLGMGPIPTFAPPAVPIGPVMGGTGTGAPGCLT